MNTQQQRLDLAPSFVNGIKDVGKAEHAAHDDAQKTEDIGFGRCAFSPNHPRGEQQQMHDKVEIELGAPIHSQQIIDSHGGPIEAVIG